MNDQAIPPQDPDRVSAPLVVNGTFFRIRFLDVYRGEPPPDGGFLLNEVDDRGESGPGAFRLEPIAEPAVAPAD
jgi:hypothetical protein